MDSLCDAVYQVGKWKTFIIRFNFTKAIHAFIVQCTYCIYSQRHAFIHAHIHVPRTSKPIIAHLHFAIKLINLIVQCALIALILYAPTVQYCFCACDKLYIAFSPYGELLQMSFAWKVL